MRKYKEKWISERREQLFVEVYEEAVDDLLEDARESPFLHLFFKRAFEDLEEDYIKFKEIVNDPEDLRYLINNPNDLIEDTCNVPIYFEHANKRKRSKIFKNQKNKINYQRKR